MSDIGTPGYVPPNEHEKLKEAVPRCVNALADVMEQLERMKATITWLEEEKRVRCPICGEMGATYGPDPYAEEIGNDDTPVWECGDCRHESAMDI